jgi:hypothetical protein
VGESAQVDVAKRLGAWRVARGYTAMQPALQMRAGFQNWQDELKFRCPM